MKIINRKQQDEGLVNIMGMLEIIETIPMDALGNSADGFNKMAKLYEKSAELAYTLDGIKGLNLVIAFFGKKARNMDEIIALSKVHLKLVDRHSKGEHK